MPHTAVFRAPDATRYRRSIFVGAHDGQHPHRDGRIGRVRRMPDALQIVVVDFPEVRSPAVFEVARFMLAVRIVVGAKIIEALHFREQREPFGVVQGANASCRHNPAPNEAFSKGIVEGADTISLRVFAGGHFISLLICW